MSELFDPLLSRVCADPLTLLLYELDPELKARCEPLLSWVVEQQSTGVLQYLQVFAKTLLLESPFYFLLLRRQPWRSRLVALFVANLATHPMVYFGFPWLSEQAGWTYLTMLILAEIFAPLTEGIVLNRGFRTELRPALLWMVLANLFSWWAGVLLVYG